MYANLYMHQGIFLALYQRKVYPAIVPHHLLFLQAIEVGDKTFVLDCREEKPGATICQAHEDWGRGEITEVGVSKLRGDVQVCTPANGGSSLATEGRASTSLPAQH